MTPPRRARGRLLELSHVIEHGLSTYPGLPGPRIEAHLSREASRARYAPGTEFHIGRIEMVANTGTYVDAPFHRFEGGADIAALGLERLADLEAVVIEARRRRGRDLGPEAFARRALEGRAVLVRTGWSSRWGSPAYFEGHPFLTAEAAQLLAGARAALVGIDSLNIDSIDGGERPVHTILLAAGIPIVEHLCGLEQLPERGARFCAHPARVRGMGSFPVRAFARVRAPGSGRR